MKYATIYYGEDKKTKQECIQYIMKLLGGQIHVYRLYRGSIRTDSEIKDFYKWDEKQKYPAVYILLGKSGNKKLFYVGIADRRANGLSFTQRIPEETHSPEIKDIWTVCFVIIFDGPDQTVWNIADLKFLEQKLFLRAKDAGRYGITQKKPGNSLDDNRERALELIEIVEEIINIIGRLQVDLFEPAVLDELIVPKPEEEELTISSSTEGVSLTNYTDVSVDYYEEIFIAKGRKYAAKGYYRQDNHFLIKKGSKVQRDQSPNVRVDFVRKKYKYETRVVNDVLVEDVECTSPSDAAVFVAGSNRGGPEFWKTENGIKLSNWSEQNQQRGGAEVC